MDTWRAVEIDATGWRVIDNPPVRFRRASGMQPLAYPVPGGSIAALRLFLNVLGTRDLRLVILPRQWRLIGLLASEPVSI